jgi:hypothetical protein
LVEFLHESLQNWFLDTSVLVARALSKASPAKRYDPNTLTVPAGQGVGLTAPSVQ